MNTHILILLYILIAGIIAAIVENKADPRPFNKKITFLIAIFLIGWLLVPIYLMSKSQRKE